ncbi:MAG: hypothetical protein K8L97_17380 [Anaerolineae bacterium]|nr:hypothetical protein [Anaerolineae bacterium]
MSREEEIRQEFQQLLKDALNQCYPYWQTRNRKDRPYELPDAETLLAWVDGSQRPQATTFKKFLEQSVFPEEIKRHLTLLYPQLQRRKPLPDNTSEIPNEPSFEKRKAKSRGKLGIVILGIGLLVIGILALLVALHISQQNEAKTWCIATASSAEHLGDVSYLYFDAAVPLHNFDEIKFYIYFDTNEYASENVLSSKKLDTGNQRWVYIISSEWVQVHPEWHIPLRWHVEYEC